MRATVAAGLALTAALGFLVWYVNFRSLDADRIFHGKPESEWIKSFKCDDARTVEEWRGYGEEGVQVLIRGFEKASPPGRPYRKLNQRLPVWLRGWLPAPQPDSTRITRQCLVWLFSYLGNDANLTSPSH